MKKKTTSILIMTTILCCNYLYGQGWQSNELTNYLEPYVVYTVSFQGEVAWFLTDHGLIKVEKNGFRMYKLNMSSVGKLEQFLDSSQSDNNCYRHMKCRDSVLWLIGANNRTVLKIVGSTIENIEFNKLVDANFSIDDFSIDKEGKLWILFKDKEFYKVFVLNGLNFKEFGKLDPSMYPYISKFFIIGDQKYFIVRNKDVLSRNYTKLLIFDEKENMIELMLDDKKSSSSFNYSNFKNHVYIVSTEGDYWDINIENKTFKTSILPIQNIWRTISFVLKDEFLFINTNDGLIKINIENNQYESLRPIDFGDNCFLEFDKIVLRNEEIWCLYGGFLRQPCNSNKYGIAILSLN